MTPEEVAEAAQVAERDQEAEALRDDLEIWGATVVAIVALMLIYTWREHGRHNDTISP